MGQKRVYLAGGIGGLDWDSATEWRDWITKELAKYDLLGISPMRAKEMLEGVDVLDKEEHMNIHPILTPKAMTTRDRWDITRAHMIIMNLLDEKRLSAGTCIEMGWADMTRTPIILACQEGGYYDKHPLVHDICGFKVRNLKDTVEIARRILLP